MRKPRMEDLCLFIDLQQHDEGFEAMLARAGPTPRGFILPGNAHLNERLGIFGIVGKHDGTFRAPGRFLRRTC